MTGPAPTRPTNPSGRAWIAWARENVLLAGTVVAFCGGAIVVLAFSVPVGTLRSNLSGPTRSSARTSQSGRPPGSSPGSSGSWTPAAPPPPEPLAGNSGPGPWVAQSTTAPSSRGLALVSHYRRLPPGGGSRYEWVVQIRGSEGVLGDVDLVTWRMDPPPKDHGDLVSWDRAKEGFPLFGDGPGGWFSVSATITFKDGNTETLSRRVELPD